MTVMVQKTPAASLTARPRALARWLFVIAALIVLMVVVGGITRLTESGLSITEWKPVTGAIPPLNEAQWAEEFARYRNSSQYVLMNQGMTLSAFKQIYFWEYFHRLMGRVLGLAFALPLIWFAIKRAIPKGYGPRLVLLLVLGGAQGAIGWLMVKSGLVDRVNVQPAMLAAHLLMALLLLSAIVWTALDMVAESTRPGRGKARLRRAAAVALAALFVQIFLGAITAGLRAGYVASSWPLMNDHFVPEGIVWWGSLWRTITSDPYLVHFLHRWWAWGAALLLILLARQAKAAGGRGASIALSATVGTQVVLGIATVLSGISLPLAVAHQAVGALVLGAAVWAAHTVGSVRRA
ncbi:COX15/CtaA family protein [Sphingobium sp. DEHP117]|uniref:COX15/CtaA family protein n=1 Tax=Sphingobium sp. DEHP117 TaxID=2993436 RepID=UPI0027D6E764|nr:COX15/CtaA family protein [Sphingobium sp. DEHP117]MDQ4420471.1 COX15/CtaA family protein [Sphingobium sp. DEHP117]